jgi:hypothetical protein
MLYSKFCFIVLTLYLLEPYIRITRYNSVNSIPGDRRAADLPDVCRLTLVCINADKEY